MQQKTDQINISNLIFILAVVQFLHILDFMIVMPLGNVFMDQLKINPQQFSYFVSVYAFAAFTSGIISASIIDRFDRRIALLFLFSGFTLGTILCGVSSTYMSLLIFRGLTGAFGGVISALVLAIIADAVPYEKRSLANGRVMMAFAVSSVVGIPLGIFIANNFGWRAPFQFIGYASLLMLIFIYFKIPSLKGHIIAKKASRSVFDTINQVLKNRNQLLALLFSFILILGHFTMIPFIAPYMESNVGFSFQEVSWIYIFGGVCSFIALPRVGLLSDKKGNQKIFVIASLCAIIPILLITHLPQVPIFVALVVTSSYFVVSAGRSVPATTIVTAVVKSENRGGFMSLRASANELALAVGSYISGMIVVENIDGSLQNYNFVGYITVMFTLLALWLSYFLKRDE